MLLEHEEVIDRLDPYVLTQTRIVKIQNYGDTEQYSDLELENIDSVHFKRRSTHPQEGTAIMTIFGSLLMGGVALSAGLRLLAVAMAPIAIGGFLLLLRNPEKESRTAKIVATDQTIELPDEDGVEAFMQEVEAAREHAVYSR